MIHHEDDWLTIHGGDCREVLRTLPAESVHCVITSPPYWGLRDYGTASWDGGDADCDHTSRPRVSTSTTIARSANGTGPSQPHIPSSVLGVPYRDVCGRCGARRIDGQLGLEATPEEYVAAMVEVFREVRRVLRDDGTLWLNLGDSYAASGGDDRSGSSDGGVGRGDRPDQRRRAGLKPKDLVGIPWRVAFALQADGWYLRSDIIWSKPNPMPESVTDRPTKSHEYLFLLAKSPRYYFDADAVRESSEFIPRVPGNRRNPANYQPGNTDPFRDPDREWGNPAGRNIRSVWTIATAPYPGAHFATFPPKLVEPCVKAGTSERGVCPECGAPWARVKSPLGLESWHEHEADATQGQSQNGRKRKQQWLASLAVERTEEWRPTCRHEAEPVPAVVLDPFAGTGTVGMVAQSLSRRAVLIDLKPDYLAQCLARNAAIPMGL